MALTEKLQFYNVDSQLVKVIFGDDLFRLERERDFPISVMDCLSTLNESYNILKPYLDEGKNVSELVNFVRKKLREAIEVEGMINLLSDIYSPLDTQEQGRDNARKLASMLTASEQHITKVLERAKPKLKELVKKYKDIYRGLPDRYKSQVSIQ